MTDASQPDHHHLLPRIEALWERPVAAVHGEAALLVRITAPEPDPSPDRAAIDVAFVLDRSGSMAGGKLEMAKTGVDLAMGRLRDEDRAALVVYDSEVETLQPLAFTTPRVKAATRLMLHGVDPRGSTFLSGGWTAGCSELAQAPAAPGARGGLNRIRRVILLTDGLANVGIVDPQELADHAGALRRRGIATTTLGVGRDFDEGLLSAMAEAGGGNFQYAADAGDLRAFFAQELQQLFSVMASGLALTLALPHGLHGRLISAFPAQRRGKEIEAEIGDLTGGDAIDLLFEMRVVAGTAGADLPVGLSAVWTDPRLDARHELDASPRPLRLGTEREAARAERDPLVAERAALQRAAAERRAGLELDRRGDHRRSREHMQRARMVLEDAPWSEHIADAMIVSQDLAAAPANAAYDLHVRKQAQYGEDLRRRGRGARQPDAPA